jgi:hypothetical protein
MLEMLFLLVFLRLECWGEGVQHPGSFSIIPSPIIAQNTKYLCKNEK